MACPERSVRIYYYGKKSLEEEVHSLSRNFGNKLPLRAKKFLENGIDRVTPK